MTFAAITGRGILLEKATFQKDGGDPIGVMFNPEQVAVKKAVGWNYQAKPKEGKGKLQFSAGQPRTISLKLQYDTSGLENPDLDLEALDVRLAIDPLYELTNVDTENSKKQPPVVLFSWGQGLSFECVIKSINVTFTKFNPDGLPIRADVQVDLMEAEAPDSQGSGGASASGTVIVANASTTASGAAGDTSADQQKKWRQVVDQNPQTFPGGNPRQAQAGQPTQTS